MVDDDGALLRDFYADRLPDDGSVAHVKTRRTRVDTPMAQVPGHGCRARQAFGLLRKFGAYRLQIRNDVAAPSV